MALGYHPGRIQVRRYNLIIKTSYTLNFGIVFYGNFMSGKADPG